MASPPRYAGSDPQLSPSRDPTQGRLPSPRLGYCDGQVTPALSPLDAFAQQGRLLAKELQDSTQGAHRLSRLPPYNVIRSFSRPRTDYFRSHSHDESQSSTPRLPDSQETNLEYENPRRRPVSEYPQFGSIIPDMDDDHEGSGSRDSIMKAERSLPPSHFGSRDLEIRRSESPIEDFSSRFHINNEYTTRRRVDIPTSFPGPPRGSLDDSVSHLNVPRSLGPPGSPLSRPLTGMSDTSDDEYSSSNAGSTFSRPRNLSSSSAKSPQPSPLHSYHRRSPSETSEASVGGPAFQRPSLNFSRPWSRTGNYQSVVAPSPRLVAHHNPPGPMNRAKKPGPLVLPPNIYSRPSVEEPTSAVSAQSNNLLDLPRGREVPLDALPASEGRTPQLEQQEPFFEASVLSTVDTRHGKPHFRSPSPAVREKPPRLYGQLPSTDPPSASRSLEVPRTARSSVEESKPAIFASNDDTNFHGPSAESIRPFTPGHVQSSALTAEEHVAIGIECHQKGSLNESAYHLRNAARHNDPTGMLLYALACRHGWGMRPNQREGVRWLRKALDLVSMELAGDNTSGDSGSSRTQEIVKKMHRAQFALSVYELGVSHLNGWGIERDKVQALHCFEISAQWGDTDAMTEAGYCYAEGVGCKKDLKKAAKFYRMAEGQGMSMVGNSWYDFLF